MRTTAKERAEQAGRECAARDFSLAGRSAKYGNRDYDAEYDRKWSRLTSERECRKVLEAIHTFWNGGDTLLSPYALISGTGMGIARDVADALNGKPLSRPSSALHDALSEECSRG